MTFLPVVSRELVVAVRRKSTRRIRFWITVTAVLVAGIFLFFTPGNSRQSGGPLFVILTAYAFGMCLLAGVFATADSLSEEKRAGTLGLLFLTDLKGYDVVLGKFIARSLNMFIALLAILPIISLALLLGGVVGAEFWRMTLALLDTLFISLTLGIFVSACSRDAQQAIGATLLGLAALLALPGLAYLLKTPALGWPSPFSCFLNAGDMAYLKHSQAFWYSLLGSHLIGWSLLIAASLLVHRAWQDKPVTPRRFTSPRFFRRGRRVPARAVKNPAVLFTQSKAGWTWAIWLIVISWVGFALFTLNFVGRDMWSIILYGTKGVGLILKVMFASLTCRFFWEARRDGAMELLLCTPLTDAEIIGAQGWNLRRLFLWPLVVFLLPLVLVLLGNAFTFQDYGQRVFGVSLGLIGANSLFAVSTVTDFLAIGWLGLWLALSMKKPALAAGVTILCVVIVPSLLICIPDIFIDVMIIAWARERLGRQDLRQMVTEQYAQSA